MTTDHQNNTCEICQGDGWVPDRSGNFPERPGVMAGPFIDPMECPACDGSGRQAAHTPGEYSARRCPKPDVSIVPKERGTIWLVQYENDEYEGEVAICAGKDAEANAKLFSAAPDLLAACEAVQRITNQLPNTLFDVKPLIDAAIAKARGQQ